jgi:hypothetical protein
MSKQRAYRPAGIDALEERLVLSSGASTLQNLAALQGSNGFVFNSSTAAQNQAFIQSLFTFIGRTPNTGAVIFHAQGLTGLGSRFNAANTFLNTQEFHNAETTFLFNFLLFRNPSSADLSAFNNYLNQPGNSFITETALILGSQEYFNQDFVGATNAGWVNAVYNDILGRDPDPGAQTWVDALNNGASRQQIAQMILTSPEGAQNLVNLAYLSVLQRDSDPLSQPFANSIVNGGRFETVLAGLLASPEYFNGVQAGTLGNLEFGQFILD